MSTQKDLEGMKPKRIAVVEKAFEKYLEAKADRAEATVAVDDAKDELHRLMVNHDLEVYGKKWRDKTYVAAVSSEETVNVKLQKKDREK